MTLDGEKALARKAAVKARQLAHAASGADAPNTLAALGLPFAATAERHVVSGFHPYKSEIDVRPLLGRLAGEGWTTCLPVVLGMQTPLIFRRWLPGEATVAGPWDIQQPRDDAPVVEPDVLLVPMLAFDAAGFRLGYGGGFYDRTLETLRAKKQIIAIGVAYAAQQIDRVPRGPHDAALDYVMTEKGIFACG